MAARTRKFTASEILLAADPANEISGLAYKGFTSVTVYNGTDNTGTVVFAGGAAPQTILANGPIRCEAGVYIEAAGTGSGSVHV